MTTKVLQNHNEETRNAWDTNATFWDERMGEGNDFFNILEWPASLKLLDIKPGQHILDIATGNGLTARKLAELGAQVTAFDFSKNMIELARSKPNPGMKIDYRVIDGTNETSLLTLGENKFDSALCNMALFDMADIEPLFQVLPRLLRVRGSFVFSLCHPCFNNSGSIHLAEESDAEGNLETVYSVKISRYLSCYSAHGVAMRDQPVAQLYFERPLQYYINLGFRSGFIVDGFEECAFPPGYPQKNPLGWGGNFSEIPPILVARMRLA